MTPKFSQAVDPVFEYVLQTLARIDGGEAPSYEEEHIRIRKAIDAADARAGQTAEWKLAKYALACWVDEVMDLAQWAGSKWWQDNTLEFHYFGTHIRSENFYVKANDAAGQHSGQSYRDALEVYYLSVVLGFRGFYEDPHPVEDPALTAERLGVPKTLRGWLDQTAAGIRLRGKPRLQPTGRMGPGAPPLERQSLMIGALLAGSVLAALVAIGCWLVFASPFQQAL